MMDRFKYKIYGQQCFNSLKELKQHLKSLTLIESDNLFYTTVYLFNVRVYICMSIQSCTPIAVIHISGCFTYLDIAWSR